MYKWTQLGFRISVFLIDLTVNNAEISSSGSRETEEETKRNQNNWDKYPI